MHRCTREGLGFDCVMCTEVNETDQGRSYVVEPEGAFSPPLFDASAVATTSGAAFPVATTSSATSDEQRGPVPVEPSGCGRCAAVLGDSSGSGAALVTCLLAWAWLLRSYPRRR